MIEVNHLTKCYGDFTAVSDLTFEIQDGGTYGFLGVNGAGKSTTMNMITGCLAATEGEVKIKGYDIFEQPREAKKYLGYLPENPPIYLNQTPWEYLDFVAEAKGLSRARRREQIPQVMELTQITGYAGCLCRNLSKGYRQRVGIAQALLGDPEVIILDEPTVGLDPRQTIAIRELIRSLQSRCTVILSSHILSEVQAICDHILILSHGKLVAFDSRDNLIHKYAQGIWVDLEVDASQSEVGKILSALPGGYTTQVKRIGPDRSMVHLEREEGNEEELCRSLFFLFAEAGYAITKMGGKRLNLEEIFIRLTEERQALT